MFSTTYAITRVIIWLCIFILSDWLKAGCFFLDRTLWTLFKPFFATYINLDHSRGTFILTSRYSKIKSRDSPIFYLNLVSNLLPFRRFYDNRFLELPWFWWYFMRLYIYIYILLLFCFILKYLHNWLMNQEKLSEYNFVLFSYIKFLKTVWYLIYLTVRKCYIS